MTPTAELRQPLLPEKAVRAALREHRRRTGRLLQAKRKSLDVTQEFLAQMTGLTQKAISHYELGIREPNDAHKVIVAAALGCAVSEIWPTPDRVEIAAVVMRGAA